MEFDAPSQAKFRDTRALCHVTQDNRFVERKEKLGRSGALTSRRQGRERIAANGTYCSQ